MHVALVEENFQVCDSCILALHQARNILAFCRQCVEFEQQIGGGLVSVKAKIEVACAKAVELLAQSDQKKVWSASLSVSPFCWTYGSCATWC